MGGIHCFLRLVSYGLRELLGKILSLGSLFKKAVLSIIIFFLAILLCTELVIQLVCRGIESILFEAFLS